jgi:hypothetical protein
MYANDEKILDFIIKITQSSPCNRGFQSQPYSPYIADILSQHKDIIISAIRTDAEKLELIEDCISVDRFDPALQLQIVAGNIENPQIINDDLLFQLLTGNDDLLFQLLTGGEINGNEWSRKQKYNKMVAYLRENIPQDKKQVLEIQIATLDPDILSEFEHYSSDSLKVL